MEFDTHKIRHEREDMVRKQIIARDIHDERVIQALLKIPRHLFVPLAYQKFAYHDTPLAIGEGQTISQPYIVAFMSELLEIQPTDRILEIGTGSGYQTAVCAECGGEVYTIERIEELSRHAQDVLETLNYQNIHFFVGDGSRGMAVHAPFDKVMVTACAAKIYPAWVDELVEGGIIVLPLGGVAKQTLICARKHQERLNIEDHGTVVFVPLIEDADLNNNS